MNRRNVASSFDAVDGHPPQAECSHADCCQEIVYEEAGMQTPSPPPCAICGSTDDRVVGRCGVACRQCLGTAASRFIQGARSIGGPVTAADFCLICGESVVTQGQVGAFHGPYRLCFVCVRDALERSNVPTGGIFSQIPIGGP